MSISSGADHFEPWAAIAVPAFGAWLYLLFTYKLVLLGVDDPINSVSVHFIGGFWGVIATGFFDHQSGLFYAGDSKGDFFAYQICGAVCIFGWTAVIAMTYFFSLYTLDLLRIEKAYEVLGMDNSYLDGVTAEDYKVFKKALEKSVGDEDRELKREQIRMHADKLGEF